MVGDIDFLINPKDKEKFIKILNNGYQYVSKSKDILSEARHIPRMIKPNKLFAIEAHTKLTNRKSLTNYSNDYINNYKILNGVAVPIFKNQILHNIYNFEINDYGSLYMNYSFKNYYDHIAINNFVMTKST